MADLRYSNLWNGNGRSGNFAGLNARIFRFRAKTEGKADVDFKSTPLKNQAMAIKNALPPGFRIAGLPSRQAHMATGNRLKYDAETGELRLAT